MNNRYIFEREYYGSVSLNLIRTASDLYSRKNCNYNETIQYAAELSNGNCFYCGKNLKIKNFIISKEAIFDHIYPASHFNLFTKGNICLSCSSCNNEKGNEGPIVYYKDRLNRGMNVYLNYKDWKELLNNSEKIYQKEYPYFYNLGTSNKYFEITSVELTKEYRLLFNNIFLSNPEYTYRLKSHYACREGQFQTFWREFEKLINSFNYSDKSIKVQKIILMGKFNWFIEKNIENILNRNIKEVSLYELTLEEWVKIFIEWQRKETSYNSKDNKDYFLFIETLLTVFLKFNRKDLTNKISEIKKLS